MKRKGLKRRHPLYRAAWFLLLGLVMTTGVLSRYVAETHSVNLARVAKFVFDASIECSDSAVVPFDDLALAISKPGDSAEFTVVVTNERGGEKSEVAQKYTVTLTLNGSMPMQCTLTKSGEPTAAASVSNVGTPSTVGAPPTDSATGQFDAGAENSVEYTLRAEWPTDEKDFKYANGGALGELVISFGSAQLD